MPLESSCRRYPLLTPIVGLLPVNGGLYGTVTVGYIQPLIAHQCTGAQMCAKKPAGSELSEPAVQVVRLGMGTCHREAQAKAGAIRPGAS